MIIKKPATNFTDATMELEAQGGDFLPNKITVVHNNKLVTFVVHSSLLLPKHDAREISCRSLHWPPECGKTHFMNDKGEFWSE